jgi:hypothetical protein
VWGVCVAYFEHRLQVAFFVGFGVFGLAVEEEFWGLLALESRLGGELCANLHLSGL